MTTGRLSEYFSGIAIKRLSAVEINTNASNQHEFNGSKNLRALFGETRKQFKATFLYLADDERDILEEEGLMTWYDSRANKPDRAAEYRFYYPSNRVTQNASENDLLLLAKKQDDSLLIIIAEAHSTIERQILWLMEQSSDINPTFSLKTEIENDNVQLNFLRRLILEKIGIETTETDETELERMLRKFSDEYPTSAQLARYVHEAMPLDPLNDPDGCLLAWYEKEYILFRTLEEHFLSEKIKSMSNVSEFMTLSLSVQNRRKSRAGLALQNHLEPILRAHQLQFATQATTENRYKPDFLFPNQVKYQDPNFPDECLLMLGAKTSLKDRWRQISLEAARISEKHLCTLESGISENQTNQIAAASIRLVVPQRYHDTFSEKQQEWLLNLGEFIDHTKSIQVSDKYLNHMS